DDSSRPRRVSEPLGARQGGAGGHLGSDRCQQESHGGVHAGSSRPFCSARYTRNVAHATVPRVAKDQARREVWTAEATDYALRHGLNGLSHRPLAASLGTSDRMLLYHFGTKDD